MVRLATRSPRRAGGATPARRCAHEVLRRVFRDDAYADRAFRAEADRARLDGRERALAQQLAYGTVQRRATLDYVLTALSSRPVEAIDPSLREALRMGVFQLLFLDGVPDHAVVDQTVELAKAGEAPGGHRFANAVMRRAAREAQGLVEELSGESPADAAVLFSHPAWLVRMWWEQLGPNATRALLERDNVPAESAVRANGILLTREELQARLEESGVASRPASDLPEALVLDGPFDVRRSAAFETGALMPQSRGSMLVGRILAPEPGERVLDLCAAPGAKTTHLAALMQGTGQVVAVEHHPGRAEELRRNLERMCAANVTVVQGDAADASEGEFDRVLLDAPCSDLGTLQARPDARWRKSPEQIEGLVAEQRRLLAAAADRVGPGGTLVYSTCTISAAENEHLVHEFLAADRDFAADDLAEEHPGRGDDAARPFLQLLPHRDGTAGFFIARLRKENGDGGSDGPARGEASA
jgi:16S rRNA (cytosine967-C5)-methyltransferase